MPIKLTQGQVEQYRLCQKRLADLIRALQDCGITVDPGKWDQKGNLPDLRIAEYDTSSVYASRYKPGNWRWKAKEEL
jgi:hypothetical protein